MRYIIFLWLCGFIQSAGSSCLDCQNEAELNFSNIGCGWSVSASDMNAFKGSGEELIKVGSSSFFILLSFDVKIELLRVEMEVVNITGLGVVIGSGFNLVANFYQNVPLDDDWGFGQQPYVFGRPDITSARIELSGNTEHIQGVRGLALTVCVPECVPGPSIVTNPSLDILPGLNYILTITGPSLTTTSDPKVSDNPIAVLEGSKKKLIFKKTPTTENGIKIAFPGGINVKNMQLKTKRATGMFVQMFGNGTTLFQKEVTINKLDVWKTTEISAPMGAINGVLDIEIAIHYNTPTDTTAKVKKLRIETCV